MSNTRMRADSDFLFGTTPLSFSAPRPTSSAAPTPAWRPAAPANPGRPASQPKQTQTGNRLLGMLKSLFVPRQKTAAELEAEGLEAKKKAESLRSREAPDRTGWAAGTHAGVSTPADMQKQAQRKEAEVADQQQRARLQLSANRQLPGFDGTTQEMDLQAYEALTPRARAAVDFNGMLQAAIARDNALLQNRDTDRSGHLTFSEAGDISNSNPGYKAAYERIFGRKADDKSSTYAPNTLALLNSLDIQDSGGRLEDYVRGHAYVNSGEMNSRAVSSGPVQGPTLAAGAQRTQDREALVSRVADGMIRLQQTLDSGRVSLGGTPQKVSLAGAMTAEGRQRAVDAISSSLSTPEATNTFRMSQALVGNQPRLTPNAGIDVSGLVDEDTRWRYEEMSAQLAAAVRGGAPLEFLTDRNALLRDGFGKGPTQGLDVDEFVALVKEQSGRSTVGRTMEDDLMEEILTTAGGN